MDTAIVIFLFLAVALIVWIVWKTSQLKRLDRQMAALSAKKGWIYSRANRTIKIRGLCPDEVGFTFAQKSFRSNRGKEQSFESEAPRSDFIVLVGPKLPAMVAGVDLGGAVVQFFLKQILGPRASEVANAVQITAKDPNVNKHHTILTDNKEEASRWLSGILGLFLAQRLAQEKPPLVIIRWHDQLTIRPSTPIKLGSTAFVDFLESAIVLATELRCQEDA